MSANGRYLVLGREDATVVVARWPMLQITSINRLNDGRVALGWDGLPGTYQPQRRTDLRLTPWANWGTTTESHVVTNQADWSQSFFRVLQICE